MVRLSVCFSDVPALRGIAQERMETRSKYLKEAVKDGLSLRWSRVLNGFTLWSNLSNVWTWATSSTHSSTNTYGTPTLGERTPCPQVANSPVKERKANDCSAQWESMGASGTMRRTSSWVKVGGGATQGELEEKGRVFQVREAAMMLREIGKSEQSIMACFKFFSPQ